MGRPRDGRYGAADFSVVQAEVRALAGVVDTTRTADPRVLDRAWGDEAKSTISSASPTGDGPSRIRTPRMPPDVDQYLTLPKSSRRQSTQSLSTWTLALQFLNINFCTSKFDSPRPSAPVPIFDHPAISTFDIHLCGRPGRRRKPYPTSIFELRLSLPSTPEASF